MANSVMLEDFEIMEQEPNIERLRQAYELLQTDRSLAITQLEKLASAGSVMSTLYLAHSYVIEPFTDDEKSEKWLRVAYEAGSARGLMHLAAHYAKREKYAEAEQIYLDGVSKNDGSSMYYLAKLYVKIDRYSIASREVMNLLESAATLGHAGAMRDIWKLYIKGSFGIQNIPKGVFLLFYYLSKVFMLSFGSAPNTFRYSDRRLW